MRPATPRRRGATGESTTTNPSTVDRLLMSFGCDPAFITDILGDLSEEYALRAADGHIAARLWYVREILRSTPHLAWNAVRSGTPASRARLAAFLLAVTATLSIVTFALSTRNGQPARLVNDAASSDGIVVNDVRPVRLSMTVVDAAGHNLGRTDVRYERVSGMTLPVSSSGVAKCTERGDAVVRATLGTLTTDFVVHCQPVRVIRQAGWGNFMVGDSARTLSVDAIGLDGEPVTRIAAKLWVEDSTVATLEGSLLRPLRAGATRIDIEMGNQTVGAIVTVFEPVRSLEKLRPDQRWVAVPVRLKRGESIRWPLPTGLFFVAFGTDTTEVPVTRGWASTGSAHANASLNVDGPIMCMPELRPGVSDTHCLARGPGATITISHSGGGPDVVGVLALERQEQR